ncbi:hypothetical protein, partial [Mitsuokella multacida]|uniref:hypothetical protein n=1 Tax=Mitsuokella multacida TaxID=52226 RepID=UPI00242ED8E1
EHYADVLPDELTSYGYPLRPPRHIPPLLRITDFPGLPEIPEFPIFPHITKFLGACLNAFM